MSFIPTGTLLNCLIAVQEGSVSRCTYCATGYIMDASRRCTLAPQGSTQLAGCKSHGYLADQNRLQCMIPFRGYSRSPQGGVQRPVSIGCLISNGNICTACDFFNGYYGVAVQASGNHLCQSSGPILIFGSKLFAHFSMVLFILLLKLGLN